VDDVVTHDMIAVIPARGGSKRIPRKNIVEFAGKPMIAWTIEAARECDLFARVLVSTDDAEIASIARSCSAEVPFMRDEAAGDDAAVTPATLAALRQAEAHWNESYATVVQLMPNCPLRGRDEIVEAVERFRANGAPFLVSCFRYGWMNPWWAHRIDASGRGEPLFKDALKSRSQDLETLYCPTGAVWIADVAALRESKTFYGPGQIFHPIEWAAAIDIDDEDDLAMARAAHLIRANAA
jgi:CMP-N-acetylneuraminic acid synthetase